MKKFSFSHSDLDSKCAFSLSLMRLMAFFVASFVLCSVVFSLSVVLRDPPSDAALRESSSLNPLFQITQDLNNDTSDSVELLQDKLRGGLLVDGFDESSCLSRYQSAMYHLRGLSGNPSSYLISRLRKYEAQHKQCGPYTEFYNKTVEQLRSDASWFLPADFPLTAQFNNFSQNSDQCHGKMLKNKSVVNSNVPSFVYLHIVHDYDDHDKLFFCDEEQHFLQEVPWLVMKTDNYFVPSLFLMPSFEQELNDLFPNKETVFHFLGRYLFHPTNSVWGLVTRYYQAYLAKVDERVGIQIRVFDTEPGPFEHVLDQILACTLKQKLLPDVNHQQDAINSSGIPKSKAVLMASLSSGYFEKVRDMYWEYPTVTGEVVGVYQPSHEGYQQTQKQTHNQKAWAEMYLLSLTDVLVTSSWSTFGYVAQGLGGLKPWILYKPENRTAPDPPVDVPCQWSHVSMLLLSMTARPREELTQVNLFHM
ncbi:hypothetical protein ACSQ67_007045 [Phaseolus vulgaris]